MKECLQCQKHFEAKRDSAKYCSDKCRVQWNRLNPKPGNTVSKIQIQALYNLMMDKLGTVGSIQPQISPFIGKALVDEPLSFDTLKEAAIRKVSRYDFYIDKINAVSELSQFQPLVKEIENDKDLTPQQINKLKMIAVERSKGFDF
jgi:hypothetical protein